MNAAAPRGTADLHGRVAVVTGSAGQLGQRMVDVLHRRGARVFGFDLGPTPVDSCRSVECDVGDPASVRAAFETVNREEASVDILVNGAGVYDNMRFTHLFSPEQWARDIRINLSGAFYTTRLALPQMAKRRWGRIVNISSMSAGGAYKQSSYGASKSGLVSLTSTTALEYGRLGITANAVLPGLIRTSKTAAAPADILEAAVKAIPSERFGEEDEVAQLVAFLASDRASYVNGVAWPIDGGTSLLQFKFTRPADPSTTLAPLPKET